jgi:hypothetical protein
MPESENNNVWFDNIILLSDSVDRHFVEWIRDILAINGTIIQIYSDREALLNFSRNNLDTYIRFCTPSLNIQNYYFKADSNFLQLCFYSPLIKPEDEVETIKICDFSFVRSNLANPEFGFNTVICKESSREDAGSAHDYFSELKNEKNLFDHLINKKPLPYFANLCKWSNELSNCQRRNTMIINDKSEIRLCWYGEKIGVVGQSYREILKNFGSYQGAAEAERLCISCHAKDRCGKCLNPFPFTNEEYCSRQRKNNISEAAELVGSFDLFKEYM